MATAVSERTWRASTPATIEHDLSALWRDIGAKGKVARAIMSNLVIVRAVRIERRAGVSIDEVVAQHPSRVLIIDHDPSSTEEGEITGARVGVVTFGPPESRYGVEQIAVRSSCRDESLPALIRRLVRGDLPISVWWAEDLSRVPLVPAILEMGRQLVYDSRQWYDVGAGVAAVAPWSELDLVDVNWRRLASIRRAVIVAAETFAASAWTPETVRVTHGWADRAMAWLLAGWVASCLDWPAETLPRVDEVKGDRLTLTIGVGPESLEIRSDGRQVVVQSANREPSYVSTSHDADAETVAAELHSLSHDARLGETLALLHRHFQPA